MPSAPPVAAIGQLFENIVCPLCESGEMDVVRPAMHPAAIKAGDICKLYSASSSHILAEQVVRCRSCSLVYVNPRPLAELVVSSYAGAVDPVFVAQNEERISSFRKSFGSVLRKIGQNSGDGRRLLDIGCAGGAFLVAARDMGFDAAGVEPSRWMAEYARRSHGLDVRDGILQPDMFPPSSFDVVTLWDVIEHVPQPHEVLTLAHEVLKPGGLLLVNFPDVGSVAARLLGLRWPFWLSVHLLYYTRKTMARQLTRAGFSVMWQQSCWPALRAGYVLERAAPYFRPFGWLIPVFRVLRLSGVPVTYNMGQTLAVCRK